MKKRRIIGNMHRPRVSVYRSNKSIYAQIIDDLKGKTLTYSSSIEKELKNFKKITKIDISYEVGKLLGYRAKKLKITKLVFDRGKYLYHGRIKSLADGIRKVGLDL
ncbi:50S ribosomal protein L18 [Blattabacterium cuenoti]|uniref:50S ribosomal protein L18 n=1 Tax=Blattabacterium cuenoti TaxID=1653831 RepID=UPI00163C45F9|nr:50S ribosomal protein L18 [Blattabacterium cuenoti]